VTTARPTFLRRVGAALRRRREHWLAPLAFVILVGWTYRTVWSPPDGKPAQWLGWDCIESYWPDISFYAGALEHGEAPLWNPYDRGGYAFYADTVTGLYYPVTWAFVGPGALAGGMPGWTQQAKMLLHHVLAGLLLYVFLRHRKLPWPAAFLGGAVFVISVPLLIHKASALFWNMVWAPLVWIAIDRALARARDPGWWWRAAALAGALGLAGAAGPPPGFFYTLLASAAYGALRLGQVLLDARKACDGAAGAPVESTGGAAPPRGAAGTLRPELLAQARVLAVAAAATVALLAIVVLPGLDVAAESATRGATRNLAYALGGSLPPGPALLGALAPPTGQTDLYLGLLVPLLAIVALAAHPRADRFAPVLFASVALIALLLAFGARGHLLPWLVEHVPGFGLFREANRYKLVTALGLAVAAAYGAAALLSDDAAIRRRARWIALGACGALAIAVAIVAATTTVGRKDVPGYSLSFAVLAVGGVAITGATLVPTRRRALALVCLVVGVHYVDVTRFGRVWIDLREAAVDDQEDRRFLAGLADVEREWRIYDEFVMEQRPGSRLRVRDLRGYPSGDPFDDARYADVRARLARDPELLAAFNVRYLLWGPHHRNGTGKNHVKGPPDAVPRFQRIDSKRWEVTDPAPLVAWYGAVTVAPDKKRALDLVAAQEKTLGGRRRAIVEAADRPRDLAGLDAVAADAAPAPVAGRLVAYGANRVVVEIDAPAAGVVVLNEKLLSGWRATVDGADAAGFRANYMLRAVVVPAGTHRIEWSYHPPRYRALFAAWLAGLAFLAAAAVAAVRAHRRRPTSVPGPGVVA
jgi:hypothetical protein